MSSGRCVPRLFANPVDIFGGFLITKRMLDLFRRATDPPEYGWLYAVPAAVFGGGFVWAASTGLGGLVAAGYFVSTMLSIGALTGLSSQVSQVSRPSSQLPLALKCIRPRHEPVMRSACSESWLVSSLRWPLWVSQRSSSPNSRCSWLLAEVWVWRSAAAYRQCNYPRRSLRCTVWSDLRRS